MTLFRTCPFLLFLLFFLLSKNTGTAQNRQQKYLEELLAIMVKESRKGYNSMITSKDSSWVEWQKRTGELPPDFDNMRSIPFLPDPLSLNKNGKDIPIKTKEQWIEKRAWIKKEFQHWISGTVPPPPKNIKAEILSEKMEGKVLIQKIEVRFGPGEKAKMTMELMIPEGKGPFPVYMTQGYHRGWAQLAVRRGYIGCVYAAADRDDDTQDYMTLYPEYDFSRLMRRAWGTSRVVDYLYTRKDVNKEQIALTGHSRNGKLTIWAAAFDERITAAVASSGGTGEITPWRYSDPQYCNETIDMICKNFPDWFHPRLRFFFGREDKLPIDQNLVISLIAPRILLFHYSIMETQHNPWANEQCYQSVKNVYNFLGAGDNVNIFPRYGEHAVSTRDLERCIDYLDSKFKRRNIPWENQTYFNYSFSSWLTNNKQDLIESQKLSPVKITSLKSVSEFESEKGKILNNVKWLLGKEPSGVKPSRVAPIRAGDWIDNITGRPVVKGAKVIHLGPYNALGEHLRGMVYYPEKSNITGGGKFPVVIFLHQYSYNHGFAYGYTNNGYDGNDRLFQVLVDKGFAVLALDMAGFGTRLEEGTYFYQRFPQWSKMGMMVRDVKACADALKELIFVDTRNIFLLVNTVGGSVALMTAAQNENFAGVSVVAAFSPWRTSNSRYESIRNYSHDHGFIPRLGLFADQPEKVPVDYNEIISCIAPRPLMVISPSLDRHADPEAVKESMNSVRRIYDLYGKGDNLIFETPLEINRMTDEMNRNIADFYTKIIKN